MKVQIKILKGGRVMKADQRLAKAFVAMGRAEYYDDATEKKTYKTKVLKADVDDSKPKKKAGRPKKEKPEVTEPVAADNTYETKVLTAEE